MTSLSVRVSTFSAVSICHQGAVKKTKNSPIYAKQNDSDDTQMCLPPSWIFSRQLSSSFRSSNCWVSGYWNEEFRLWALCCDPLRAPRRSEEPEGDQTHHDLPHRGLGRSRRSRSALQDLLRARGWRRGGDGESVSPVRDAGTSLPSKLHCFL